MSLPLDEYRKLLEQHGLLQERKFIGEVAQRYVGFIDDFLINAENIAVLRDYLPAKGSTIDLDTVKIWLLLMRKGNRADITKILSYLEPIDFGWHKNKYICYNPCLRDGFLCKPKYHIQDMQSVRTSLKAINEIFFDKEYGRITLLVFNYCLASLFSSRLNQSSLPRYLQIACDRNTVLYNLIREIVAICDVNMGIHEECKNYNRWSCSYNINTVYPVQDIESNLSHLNQIKDVPVIVDGHENLRNYHALLRTVANRSNKKNIDWRGNVLPIFVCPAIKFSPNNFLSINMTGEIVSEDYLSLIKENKKMLSSLVVGLILDFIECLFPEDGTDEDRDTKYVNGEYPFSNEILRHVSRVRGECAADLQTAKNAGVLSFFFTGLMRAFSRAVNIKNVPLEKEFTYTGEPLIQNTVKHILSLMRMADQSFVEFYSRYTPVPIDSIDVNVEGADPHRINHIEKKARKYAIDIVRCYQSFEVSISITKIEVRGERYVFHIELSEGTRRHKVFKEAEDVKATMRLEYFKPVKDGLSLYIVAAEKPLKESSLIDIMDAPVFRNSAYKIPFAIGHDITGEMVVEDLSKVRHVLVGGSTGSGKSTALHCLLLSVVCKQSVDDVNLLIFDFGITYLSQFRKVPHLSHPIVYDMDVGFEVVMKLYAEMERRRDIYRKNPDDRSEFNKLPDIFCIIDEFPDFIRHGADRKKKKALQETITGLLERGRGVKIHLVLAAQDPTEENMKCGVTNLGTCLAFKCSREHNSRVMLNESGAENLLGNGDMLLKLESSPGPRSIQGAYIDEKDIAARLKKHLCTSGDGKYKFSIDESETTNLQSQSDNGSSGAATRSSVKNEFDSNAAQLIMLLLEQGQISNDQIQRELVIAYHKANEYLFMFEKYNLIPPLNGRRKPRKAIPKRIEDLSPVVIELLERNGYTKDDIINALHQKPGNVATQND